MLREKFEQIYAINVHKHVGRFSHKEFNKGWYEFFKQTWKFSFQIIQIS